ncbi:PREDICTED: uncharacterized protein LOC106725609 [Myotis brandtii]|uniref:uncharacterized protein LOC106725609 n=1 Tax=Myotis brandtii TaxID=109478 RepID=UPI0007041B2F|nr:PREDICTED: uncharacterized protein LOC106725609 [Myotis brandtii]
MGPVLEFEMSCVGDYLGPWAILLVPKKKRYGKANRSGDDYHENENLLYSQILRGKGTPHHEDHTGKHEVEKDKLGQKACQNTGGWGAGGPHVRKQQAQKSDRSNKHLFSTYDKSKSMTGIRNSFVAFLKEKINHEILTYHCIIHQEALCAQTFPEEICKVMELVIKIINSIIAKALNHRQFKEFLVEMESEYADLLLHNKMFFCSLTVRQALGRSWGGG